MMGKIEFKKQMAFVFDLGTPVHGMIERSVIPPVAVTAGIYLCGKPRL